MSWFFRQSGGLALSNLCSVSIPGTVAPDYLVKKILSTTSTYRTYQNMSLFNFKKVLIKTLKSCRLLCVAGSFELRTKPWLSAVPITPILTHRTVLHSPHSNISALANQIKANRFKWDVDDGGDGN